jgi:hypothetical protein
MTKARVNADNASADIQGVTAGTGLTGGGTSGTVTLDVDTTTIQARVANVTDTEIGYLDGVSSAIQTQLNARITNALVDAKGDIIAATANDTPARLGVGANGTFLKANSATATGLEWGTVAAGANWTLVNSGGTGLSGTTTTVSGISGADKILLVIQGGMSTNTTSPQIFLRLNGDTSSNYSYSGIRLRAFSSYLTDIIDNNYYAPPGNTNIPFGEQSNNAGSYGSGFAMFSGCNTSGLKAFQSGASFNPFGGSGNQCDILNGVYNSTSTISSISISTSAGSFDRGSVYVYTSA